MAKTGSPASPSRAAIPQAFAPARIGSQLAVGLESCLMSGEVLGQFIRE